MHRSLLLPVALLSLTAGSRGAEIPMQPFTIDWSRAGESVIDLSNLLDAPAGKGGHIRMQGEHLVKPDGSRFRIWGVNICGPECFPSKESAPLIAGDLARLGVNCVRFHHLDSNWGRSVFNTRRDDTRELDPENLDRLDFFIAELAERGIYSNINLNVLRHFKAGDGVRDWKILGIGKSATYFNPRLIELQHEYARQLLTHRNPYTGHEHRHDPVVAVVEMVNENSVVEGWAGWRLVGRDDKAGDTWSPIPVSYAEELTDQYNAWLEKKLSAAELEALRKEAGAANGRVPRLQPDQFGKASRLRFHSEAAFYMEVERTFFEGMKRLLREELGVKALLVGSSDHNDGISGYPHIRSNLVFDVVDGHGYWEHPHLGKETWIKNTPMVNDPLDSTVTQFARTPVAGRPYTISETNHPWPHDYACEGYPILTAYALLHDWDGIYWFDYGAGRNNSGDRGMGHWFSFGNDPMKLSNLAACALLWHRRDVKAAERLVVRSYSVDQVIESLRLNSGKERPFFTPGFARSTPLQFRTRFTLEGGPATEFPPAAPLSHIAAQTGELDWYGADQKKGLVTVDTARSQALIGFVSAAGRSVTHLSAEVKNDFCSLVLTSLDGKPLAGSGRMLLAATARVANTGQRWKDDRQTLAEWGRLPAQIEPVTGTVTLRKLGEVEGLKARALTPEGRALDGELKSAAAADGWQITLGEPATTWVLIEVQR